MVGIGLFTAIVMVLQFLGGGIKFGVFSISLVLVPIVVGAAVYGWTSGGILGFAFGAAVLLSGDAAAFLAVDPLATVGVVLVKGIACGITAGLIYKLFAKVNMTVGVFAAAIICPVVNTGVFIACMLLFFKNVLSVWAGGVDLIAYILSGLVLINFVPELIINIVFSPAGQRILNAVKK